jgi:hypothetical protein
MNILIRLIQNRRHLLASRIWYSPRSSQFKVLCLIYTEVSALNLRNINSETYIKTAAFRLPLITRPLCRCPRDCYFLGRCRTRGLVAIDGASGSFEGSWVRDRRGEEFGHIVPLAIDNCRRLLIPRYGKLPNGVTSGFLGGRVTRTTVTGVRRFMSMSLPRAARAGRGGRTPEHRIPDVIGRMAANVDYPVGPAIAQAAVL